MKSPWILAAALLAAAPAFSNTRSQDGSAPERSVVETMTDTILSNPDLAPTFALLSEETRLRARQIMNAYFRNAFRRALEHGAYSLIGGYDRITPREATPQWLLELGSVVATPEFSNQDGPNIPSNCLHVSFVVAIGSERAQESDATIPRVASSGLVSGAVCSDGTFKPAGRVPFAQGKLEEFAVGPL